MKVRQRKYQICMGQFVRMMLGSFGWRANRTSVIDAGGTTKDDPRRVSIDWEGLMQRQSTRLLVEEEVDDTLEKIAEEHIFGTAGGITKGSGLYTVARKKDGEIIGTYTTEADAQAVIDKAKASKKAALVLL